MQYYMMPQGMQPGQPYTPVSGAPGQAQPMYMPMAVPMTGEYGQAMAGYGYMPVSFLPPGYPAIAGGNLLHGRIGSEADNLVMMHNSRRGVNKRWVLEPEDSILLERVFALEKCPGRELCQELATRLKVRPRQVQVWFQNRRQRTKSNAAKAATPAATDSLQEASDAASRSEMLMKLLASSAHPIATATPAGDMPGMPSVEVAHPIASAVPAADATVAAAAVPAEGDAAQETETPAPPAELTEAAASVADAEVPTETAETAE